MSSFSFEKFRTTHMRLNESNIVFHFPFQKLIYSLIWLYAFFTYSTLVNSKLNSTLCSILRYRCCNAIWFSCYDFWRAYHLYALLNYDRIGYTVIAVLWYGTKRDAATTSLYYFYKDKELKNPWEYLTQTLVLNLIQIHYLIFTLYFINY